MSERITPIPSSKATTLHSGDKVITMREMSVTEQHQLVPVKNPQDEFTRAYWHLLSKSDFNCIRDLITLGKVEVCLDVTTGVTTLVAEGKSVQRFLDNVFGSLHDDAEYEARRVR